MNLLDNRGNNAGSNGSAAFTDSKAQTFFDGDGGNQLDGHLDVVSGHNHFNPFRKLNHSGYVCGSEVELGTIAVEERGMAAAFFLAYINLGEVVG